jgi:hypothetical protein
MHAARGAGAGPCPFRHETASVAVPAGPAGRAVWLIGPLLRAPSVDFLQGQVPHPRLTADRA